MSGLIAIGAAAAVITGVGAGIGIGLATSKAVDAIARQPEADGKITKALLLGCALAEATAILRLCNRPSDHSLPEIIKNSEAEKGRYYYVKHKFLEYCLYGHQPSGAVSVPETFLMKPLMEIMEKRQAQVETDLNDAASEKAGGHPAERAV